MSARSALALLLVCVAAPLAFAAIPAHLITSLPGFNGTLPSKQYSGYISVDDTNGRYLHYWFVESESDPVNDPVVLWMNGGPGCSSLDGYFYEQGPLHFVNDQEDHLVGADAVPALELNPSRWNRVANMLFLEAPAGVGFSYSNTQSDYNTDDDKTAADNWQLLVNFFKAYPEYAKNRFFVSGESYAGIYVPTLVNQIRVKNAANQSNINLEGFMVGNGCIGNAVGNCGSNGTANAVEFLYGHGLYEKALYQQIKAQCTDYNNPSIECDTLLGYMSMEVGDVNIYNIYAPCINGAREKVKRRGWKMSHEEILLNSRTQRIPGRGIDSYAKSVRGPDECIDGISAGQYLNNDAVRAAIHVLPSSQLPSWTICTSAINYNRNTDSLLPIYPTLIQTYRTLIYNGDVDACVPYNGDEDWTSGLGFQVDAGWHQWLLDDQVAGYATTYKTNGFTFITVKGSGHMVPEYRPEQAFEMFNRFLTKTPF